MTRFSEMPKEWRRPSTPKTHSAAELLAKDLPPVKWAVPGLVPEGVSFLAGKPKLGKSWLGLGLCISVAAGGYALGTKKVEKGAALYLGLEDNERRLKSRLEKILAGGGCPEGLDYATEWPRLDEGGLEGLEAWLESHPDARLIVVDTLAKVKPRTSGRRNAYDEDRDAVDPLAPLVARHGVAIQLVHHLRKMAASDPLDEISGTLGLVGGVDGALVLKRERGRADAYLHVSGREIEEDQELALRWDQNLASWTLAGDAEEYRLNEQRARIVEVLREAVPENMSAKQVAEATGEPYNPTRQRLYQMSKAGEVKALGGGKYTIPNNPNSPNNANDPNSTNNMTSRYENGEGQSELVRDTTVVPNIHNPDGHDQNGASVRDVRDVRDAHETAVANGLRRLTEEEARRVQKLVTEGMSPKWAREQVLGVEP